MKMEKMKCACFRREFWAARDDWEQMMKQPYMIDYVRVYQVDKRLNQ